MPTYTCTFLFVCINSSHPGAAEKEQLQKSHTDLADKHQKDLADLKAAHAIELKNVSLSVSEEKDRLEGQVQKYKDLAEDAEEKAKAWISQLSNINGEMSSKSFPSELLILLIDRYMLLTRFISRFFQKTFLTLSLMPQQLSTSFGGKEPRKAL